MTTRQPEVLRVRRDKLGRPPRKDVLLPGDQLGKHARFFSTGDELHDDLVRQAFDMACTEKMTFRPVGIFLPDEPPFTGLIGKTILLVRSAWRLSRIIDQQFNMKASDAAAVRTGQQADRRWLSTMYPDQLRSICLVISDDGTVEPAPGRTEQVLLSEDCRPTTNPKQQQIIPVSRFARAILDDIKKEWQQQERQRVSALRVESQPAFENRRQIMVSDTETYVRWKQLRIEELKSRNIKDPQQRQLNAGQIAAERRRMELRIAGMNDRLRAIEGALSKLTEPAEMEGLIMLVKVLPPPNRIL